MTWTVQSNIVHYCPATGDLVNRQEPFSRLSTRKKKCYGQHIVSTTAVFHRVTVSTHELRAYEQIGWGNIAWLIASYVQIDIGEETKEKKTEKTFQVLTGLALHFILKRTCFEPCSMCLTRLCRMNLTEYFLWYYSVVWWFERSKRSSVSLWWVTGSLMSNHAAFNVIIHQRRWGWASPRRYSVWGRPRG